MKYIFATLMLAPAIAMPCLPGGSLLSAEGKADFAKDLKAKNPSCARKIERRVGKLDSKDILVYELAHGGKAEYRVVGKSAEIQMSYFRIFDAEVDTSRMTYVCDKVTGRKRCM